MSTRHVFRLSGWRFTGNRLSLTAALLGMGATALASDNNQNRANTSSSPNARGAEPESICAMAEVFFYGFTPTPAQRKAVGAKMRQCQAGMTLDDFYKAVDPLPKLGAPGRRGGGPLEKSYEIWNFGHSWKLVVYSDRTQDPPILVEATFYTIRTLTPAESQSIRAAIEKRSKLSAMKEMKAFWDAVSPSLEELCWHTAALDSSDFRGHGATVGDHYISFVRKDRSPEVDVEFSPYAW